MYWYPPQFSERHVHIFYPTLSKKPFTLCLLMFCPSILRFFLKVNELKFSTKTTFPRAKSAPILYGSKIITWNMVLCFSVNLILS